MDLMDSIYGCDGFSYGMLMDLMDSLGLGSDGFDGFCDGFDGFLMDLMDSLGLGNGFDGFLMDSQSA